VGKDYDGTKFILTNSQNSKDKLSFFLHKITSDYYLRIEREGYKSVEIRHINPESKNKSFSQLLINGTPTEFGTDKSKNDLALQTELILNINS